MAFAGQRASRICIAAIGVAALAALQGCTSYVSKGITDDGKAEELVWPAERNARQPEGSFPNRDNLRAVRPGDTKNQLYELLGRPHFEEGMFAVREWDYIFRFRSGGDEVATCRYKVIFDRDYKAQSFHWLPAACAGQAS
ncbi:outer membrane protein assembly factor BamE (lipoprotein component of BamABCDE complex) [Variovorax boronicumulans]|uniref:outer membrane protein assembly factor BamE n=1 Tax=Variovorax boronicumulans TaxID=436515 RepID=UPI002474C69D|nr:outer membrane protein assembly factor BamE [Variovorax boronicumulans]MDH6166491.1 outer membrane protein assembly factor BamE (lipoprotein component of BamABCDE complex) [Variovorax boronicumulans]